MKETLVTGKSTSKIIAEFMKKNGLGLNDFKFEVVEEGSNGFMGLFGTKPTTIKFIYDQSKVRTTKSIPKSKTVTSKKAVKKPRAKKQVSITNSNTPEIIKMIREFTEGILAKMNIETGKIDVTQKDGTFYVTINNSKDAGFIIGKEAKMLDSFQHLLNQMVNKAEKKKIQIILDVDGYRDRRLKALLEKVDNLSKKVIETGISYTLEPLHSSNRKAVHQHIENNKKLRTRTIGEGSRKRVVILPATKSTSGKPRSK